MLFVSRYVLLIAALSIKWSNIRNCKSSNFKLDRRWASVHKMILCKQLICLGPRLRWNHGPLFRLQAWLKPVGSQIKRLLKSFPEMIICCRNKFKWLNKLPIPCVTNLGLSGLVMGSAGRVIRDEDKNGDKEVRERQIKNFKNCWDARGRRRRGRRRPVEAWIWSRNDGHRILSISSKFRQWPLLTIWILVQKDQSFK